eukprot:gene5732-5670_t
MPTAAKQVRSSPPSLSPPAATALPGPVTAAECNAKCAGQSDKDGCDLVCELTYGYGNPAYTALLQ